MWKPDFIDTDKVLYIAIADAIEADILKGILKINEKMPTQRLIAKVIGVNLTTITRAYKEAERRGLISGIVGKGTFVSAKQKIVTIHEINDENDIIELGGVSTIKDDINDLTPIMKEMAKVDYLDILTDYVPSQGLLRHRETAAKWIKQYGVDAKPENIVICAGAMHAINCTLMALFEGGDRIAVDQFTFTGFKNSASFNNIKLEAVLMDEEGMIPESLENLCKKFPIKGIYLMPNMQNPTATVMSDERKQAIAELILKYDLILIEDDIYNFTSFRNRTSISTLVPDNSIFICGISKAFFPGLRISFAFVPEKYLYKIIQAVANTICMAPPICAELVIKLIETEKAFEIIEKKKKIISQRMELAKKMFSNFKFNATENSMFLWLYLPEGWSSTEFENIALANKVRVIGSHKFCVGNGSSINAVRISLAPVKNEERLTKGFNILVRLLNQNPLLNTPIM